MDRLSPVVIPRHRPARAARAFLPRGPSIKPEWFSESLDGWTNERTCGRMDGRAGTQKVETVAHPRISKIKGSTMARATDGWYSTGVETTASNHSPITMPGAAGL